MNERSKKLMAEYIDRGMIKWQPFAALEGHGEYVKAEAIKRLKTSKPILSSDQKDRLDKKLKLAIESNNKVMVKYFKEGFIEIVIGRINNVNKYKEEFTINNISLKTNDVIDIKL